MKFHILIYGCQMNYSDSARIKSVLQNSWFLYVPTVEEADLVIFDTCSVRQKSEDKIFWKLQDISKEKKVWITGCMVQRNLKIEKKKWNFSGNVKTIKPTIIWFDREEVESNRTLKDWSYLFVNYCFWAMYTKTIASFPNVELFFRIDDVGFLPVMAERLWYPVVYDQEITNEYMSLIPQVSANQQFLEGHKTVYVPISTWCSQFCAYCIVPYARWLEKNRSFDDIMTEVDFHIKKWAKEIVLIWQIVNKHPEFDKIVASCLKYPELKWLRYTSPYPTHYSKELLLMHQNEEALCPHIHNPMQSWSSKILKKMFRGYNADQYREFISNMRSLSRPISITTDIIVGFVDETDEDFQDTLSLVEYAKFDMIYVWIYSVRPWTYAANKYKDNIPTEVKKQRWTILTENLRKISHNNNQADIWLTKDMMVTEVSSKAIFGYTDSMKNVVIENPSNEILNLAKTGEFLTTTIISGDTFKLKWKNSI